MPNQPMPPTTASASTALLRRPGRGKFASIIASEIKSQGEMKSSRLVLIRFNRVIVNAVKRKPIKSRRAGGGPYQIRKMKQRPMASSAGTLKYQNHGATDSLTNSAYRL